MTSAVAMPGSSLKTSESMLPFAALRMPQSRSALIVIVDDVLRASLASELKSLRWDVREAKSAAIMFDLLDQKIPSACILDSWLPDLDARECVEELASLYPELDILTSDGTSLGSKPARGAYRGELLHALRQVQEGGFSSERGADKLQNQVKPNTVHTTVNATAARIVTAEPGIRSAALTPSRSGSAPLEELIGLDARMLEVSRRIRLVAARKTTVMVHGETGTGKELVARALHRLSGLPGERFVSINCAAIPESLVEAELFGYARGAFTGAVQSRIGRIEAAAGGTLFLDEIGELPLAVQGKLLRFLECGEIQRVGENEPIRVSARVVTATHRKLGTMAREGSFRLDLLHRLSVFLIETPALAGRNADLDLLIAHGLEELAENGERKQLSEAAREKLHAHTWPGNVRELMHTLERAWILADDQSVIDVDSVDFGEALL